MTFIIMILVQIRGWTTEFPFLLAIFPRMTIGILYGLSCWLNLAVQIHREMSIAICENQWCVTKGFIRERLCVYEDEDERNESRIIAQGVTLHYRCCCYCCWDESNIITVSYNSVSPPLYLREYCLSLLYRLLFACVPTLSL